MNRDQMRDILLSDFARWQEREAAQYGPSRATLASYAEDAKALKGIGMVSGTEVRYAERWRPTKLDERTKAEMSGVEVITADGKRTVVSQSSFRKSSSKSRRPVVTETRHRITSADLPAIGNVD